MNGCKRNVTRREEEEVEISDEEGEKKMLGLVVRRILLLSFDKIIVDFLCVCAVWESLCFPSDRPTARPGFSD